MAEFADFLIHSEEYLLCQIKSILLIVDHPVSRIVNLIPVLLEQSVKSCNIPVLAKSNEFGVFHPGNPQQFSGIHIQNYLTFCNGEAHG